MAIGECNKRQEEEAENPFFRVGEKVNIEYEKNNW